MHPSVKRSFVLVYELNESAQSATGSTLSPATAMCQGRGQKPKRVLLIPADTASGWQCLTRPSLCRPYTPKICERFLRGQFIYRHTPHTPTCGACSATLNGDTLHTRYATPAMYHECSTICGFEAGSRVARNVPSRLADFPKSPAIIKTCSEQLATRC